MKIRRSVIGLRLSQEKFGTSGKERCSVAFCVKKRRRERCSVSITFRRTKFDVLELYLREYTGSNTTTRIRCFHESASY
ncbi:unnamed protein product [Amoebophrya sp. A25]|nr:unnamed protein product [Amoebophrya sp. A25]CAD7975792.1 unnamed protein product [Amoebophrya sp. A25]|eukprot:GSA25T00026648001.1